MSAADRFAEGGARYDRFRPTYPASLLDAVAAAIRTVSSGGPVVDVGAGTGIFTRQLATALPELAVIGLEPSASMREQAAAGGGARFVDGDAERLPFADGSVRAVTAAAAAHWFDRPRFYAEAARVLPSGGVLALLDYPRDLEGSPAAAAAQDFLDRHGEGRAYVRPDYALEIDALPAFGPASALFEAVVSPLAPEAYVELVLSSSHARAVEARLGVGPTRDALMELARGLADEDGLVRHGVRFRLFLSRRL